MEQRYYLASLRNAAWMTGSGQWSTDLEQARDFNHMEALAQAKLFRENQHTVVPVAVADIKWINA